MGQGIDELSLDTLLELFQAITEPRGDEGGWRGERADVAEGGPFETVTVPNAADEPVPMDEASDADGGTWLWLEH